MRHRTAQRWAAGLVLLAAVGVALTQRGRFDAAALQAWVEGAGAAGPVLFMVLYAVATVLFLPGGGHHAGRRCHVSLATRSAFAVLKVRAT